jgi:WD40 repeat protein
MVIAPRRVLLAFLGVTAVPAFVAAQARVDLYADPLPAGALVRLGTVRFRHPFGEGGVAFTPDGRHVAGGNPVWLWDVATGRVVRRFPMPHAEFFDSAPVISPDGTLLAAAAGLSADGRIYVWEVGTGRELRQWRDAGCVKGLAFSPDGRWLAACNLGGVVTLRDVSSGRELRRLIGHRDAVRSVAFSPDGRTLVTGGDDTVRLWDAATGDCRRTLRSPGAVEFAVLSPDAKFIAAGGGLDEPIRLWDVTAGQVVREFAGDRHFKCAAFTPDGQSLVAAIEDKMTFWDVTTGHVRRSFPVADDQVYHLAFAPDGKTLAVEGCGLAFYDVATGREFMPGRGHRESVKALAFLPGDRTVATVTWDRTVRLWDAATGREVRQWPATVRPGDFTPSFSPDGRTVVLPAPGPVVRVVGTETGKLLAEVKTADEIAPKAVALAPDGRTFAAYDSIHNRTALWDVATGRQRLTINGPNHTASRLAYAPDGHILATGGVSGAVRTWNTANGRLLHALETHERQDVDCLEFSPDGKVLATCANGLNNTDDHVIRLWDVATGRELHKLVGHTRHVKTLAFAPDGKALASGSEDGVIRLWDAATGRRTHEFPGHGGEIEVLRFSGDGRILAAANADTTVLLWDVGALPKRDAK